jgi:hypothetical protein
LPEIEISINTNYDKVRTERELRFLRIEGMTAFTTTSHAIWKYIASHRIDMEEVDEATSDREGKGPIARACGPSKKWALITVPALIGELRKE